MLNEFIQTNIGKIIYGILFLVAISAGWCFLSVLQVEKWHDAYRGGREDLEKALCYFDEQRQPHLVSASKKLVVAWNAAHSLPFFIPWSIINVKSFLPKEDYYGKIYKADMKKYTSKLLILAYCALGDQQQASEYLQGDNSIMETLVKDDTGKAFEEAHIKYLALSIFPKYTHTSAKTTLNSLEHMTKNNPQRAAVILNKLAQYCLTNYDQYLTKSRNLTSEYFQTYTTSYRCDFAIKIIKLLYQTKKQSVVAKSVLLTFLSEKRNISQEEYSWSSDPAASALVRSRAGDKAFRLLRVANALSRVASTSNKSSVIRGEANAALKILQKFSADIYSDKEVEGIAEMFMHNKKIARLLKKIGKRSLPFLEKLLRDKKSSSYHEQIKNLVLEIRGK
ncbi:hypothetical protein [Candidatus Uabimicrobium sp. HlEnr_7]|uniref:hypothetical protein n=1 Tax=Candidatus Uabimicrobium helgolandensis TaxID=3095367 RepID=UPI003559353B